jgi:hypothetical protein
MCTHAVSNNDPGRWLLDAPEAEVMSREKERGMLLELADCTARLLQATRRRDGSEWGSTAGDAEFQRVVCDLANAGPTTDPHTAALRAVARRHQEIRTALAMANSHLVVHLAKRFRNREIAIAELIQEGFCGLLMAIDRFDTANTTRLATSGVAAASRSRLKRKKEGGGRRAGGPVHFTGKGKERRDGDPGPTRLGDDLRRTCRPCLPRHPASFPRGAAAPLRAAGFRPRCHGHDPGGSRWGGRRASRTPHHPHRSLPHA